MHNFSPFSVKMYTYIVIIYDFGGGKGALPFAQENFVFGGLNLHNFRPLFSLTFYKDHRIFWGGSRILQPPLKILRGLSP